MIAWQWHQLDHKLCKSFAPRFRQITKLAPYQLIFTGQMLFLSPNERCQRTEGLRGLYSLLNSVRTLLACILCWVAT